MEKSENPPGNSHVVGQILSSQTESRGKRGASWVNSVLPFSIALGPVGTLVQLLILYLHGTIIEVSLAVTLSSAVSVPAAVIWGFVTDRFHKRKPIVVASYLVTAGVLVSFLMAKTTYSVSLLYALFSLISSASTTPLNLLIMETERKQKWATAFAKFSMISSIGNTVGLLLSMAWGLFSSLEYLVVLLATLSLISALLSVFMIKEPDVLFEPQAIVLNRPSFFHRLKVVPLFFLKVPRASDFKRIFRNLKCELTRHVPILYFSIFAFYFASGLFNTSIVPSLLATGFSSFEVFLVESVGMVVQILAFNFSGSYIEKRMPVKAAIAGLVLRSVCYGLFGLSVFMISGSWLLLPALIFYPLAAGIGFSVYYTASSTMVFNLLGHERQGHSLGVYSALLGIASLTGSLISGFSSFFAGFSLTFVLAAAFLGLSAWLTSLLRTCDMGAATDSACSNICD